MGIETRTCGGESSRVEKLVEFSNKRTDAEKIETLRQCVLQIGITVNDIGRDVERLKGHVHSNLGQVTIPLQAIDGWFGRLKHCLGRLETE